MSGPEPLTVEQSEFLDAWSAAFRTVIALARAAKPHLGDPEVARRFAEAASDACAHAGMTFDEAKGYTGRILSAVLAEPQA